MPIICTGLIKLGDFFDINGTFYSNSDCNFMVLNLCHEDILTYIQHGPYTNRGSGVRVQLGVEARVSLVKARVWLVRDCIISSVYRQSI